MQQQPTLRSTTLLALDFERWQNVVKYLNSFRTTSMFFNFVRFYVKTFPPLGFSFLLSFYHLVWLPIWAHNEVKLLRFFDNGSMEWRKFFFFLMVWNLCPDFCTRCLLCIVLSSISISISLVLFACGNRYFYYSANSTIDDVLTLLWGKKTRILKAISWLIFLDGDQMF